MDPILHQWDIDLDPATGMVVVVAMGLVMAYWTFRLRRIRRANPGPKDAQ